VTIRARSQLTAPTTDILSQREQGTTLSAWFRSRSDLLIVLAAGVLVAGIVGFHLQLRARRAASVIPSDIPMVPQ
jgi:hypothetical protein